MIEVNFYSGIISESCNWTIIAPRPGISNLNSDFGGFFNLFDFRTTCNFDNCYSARNIPV